MRHRTGMCSNCDNPEARHDYCPNCGHGDPLHAATESELERLRAENAALQKTNASLRADIENPSPDMQERARKRCRHFEIVCELRAENAQLRQQVEGLRAIVIPVGLAQDRMREDAERYRWLRAHGDADGCPSCWCYYDGIHMQQGEMLDAAIDAARV